MILIGMHNWVSVCSYVTHFTTTFAVAMCSVGRFREKSYVFKDSETRPYALKNELVFELHGTEL
jgi:hypothetical protein